MFGIYINSMICLVSLHLPPYALSDLKNDQEYQLFVLFAFSCRMRDLDNTTYIPNHHSTQNKLLPKIRNLFNTFSHNLQKLTSHLFIVINPSDQSLQNRLGEDLSRQNQTLRDSRAISQVGSHQIDKVVTFRYLIQLPSLFIVICLFEDDKWQSCQYRWQADMTMPLSLINNSIKYVVMPLFLLIYLLFRYRFL